MKKPSSSSSEIEVITNQDLLSEILSHVPARSLMRLQLVSKQWLSLITSKTFSLIHRHHGTTAAIFMQITTYILDRSPLFTEHIAYRRLDLSPLENSRLDKSSPFRSSAFHHDPNNYNDVLILQSCHGLLLCRTADGKFNRYNQPNSGFYYVYNPTTNRVATIDGQWHPKTTIYASVLVFDPDESLHYRLVFFVKHNRGRQLQCLVYSSEHGTWKSSSGHPFVPPFVRRYVVFMRKYVYFKGCIYWTSESRLKTDEILYYNVDEDVFGTLPWPGTLPKYKKRRVYLGQSASHLHFVETCPAGKKAATSLDVYELNSHHSGWFVKYRVDLTQLFSEMNTIGNYIHKCALEVLTLVRREHFGEDSVLVLETPAPDHQYIVYNLIDETWKVIWQNLPGYPKVLFSGGYGRALDFIDSLTYV